MKQPRRGQEAQNSLAASFMLAQHSVDFIRTALSAPRRSVDARWASLSHLYRWRRWVSHRQQAMTPGDPASWQQDWAALPGWRLSIHGDSLWDHTSLGLYGAWNLTLALKQQDVLTESIISGPLGTGWQWKWIHRPGVCVNIPSCPLLCVFEVFYNKKKVYPNIITYLLHPLLFPLSAVIMAFFYLLPLYL